MRAVPSGQNSMSLHVRAVASDRLGPAAAMTPIFARSTVPRACAMAVVSVLLLRPAAPRKAGNSPGILARGIAGECIGLFGRWSLVAPAFEDLGRGWMAGGIVALRYALGGMGVGDRGSGLRDGGDGLAAAARLPR